MSEDFFWQLQKQSDKGQPFAAYRKPNEITLKALLQKDAVLHHISDFTESGFVFAPFDDKNEAVLIPSAQSEIINGAFVMSHECKISQEKAKPFAEGKQFHIHLVQKGIDAIKTHQFKKVVLSRCETVQLTEANPMELFKRLLSTYKTAFVYCWYHPKVGLWLGATPETLLQIEGTQLTTMALAGTQKFDGILDVVWLPKEKEEQQIVTDFIVGSLQPSVGSLYISETETVRAGNLLHLNTTIKANLKPQTFNLKQLLEALHPTPAVCGIPKENAKRFILKNENYNREFYTGFLGELNLKEKRTCNSNRHNIENDAYASIKTVSNLFVNLRCMQLKGDMASIYVGGGITNDSIPEDEFNETIFKTETIKKILFT
ncbi:MAG: chorismate-binding protein [Gelidibacter sp.]